jgi:DoxX-like family
MMQMVAQTDSKATIWASRVITALPAFFLLMDGVMKLIRPAIVVDTTVQLGYSAGVILPIGIALLACLAVYLIPSTSVLGAILLTGYLGGAVATHVRAGTGLFPVLFPVIIAALLWGGLYLRDPQLRALIPLRRTNQN